MKKCIITVVSLFTQMTDPDRVHWEQQWLTGGLSSCIPTSTPAPCKSKSDQHRRIS